MAALLVQLTTRARAADAATKVSDSAAVPFDPFALLSDMCHERPTVVNAGGVLHPDTPLVDDTALWDEASRYDLTKSKLYYAIRKAKEAALYDEWVRCLTILSGGTVVSVFSSFFDDQECGQIIRLGSGEYADKYRVRYADGHDSWADRWLCFPKATS